MATIIPRVGIPQSNIGGLSAVQPARGPDRSGQLQLASTVNKLAQDLGQQWQERNDTAALIQARRELADWETATFSPANADGIAKYKGGNALEAGEALVPKLDERIGQIRQRLNPRQQARFDALAEGFRESVSGRVNTHMDREHNAYLETEQAAALENFGTDAVNAGVGGDFARKDQIATELLAMDAARLRAQGAGAQTIRASQSALASSVRVRTIKGMLANMPFEAQAYFEKYQDQMSPEDRLQTEVVLRPIVQDAESTAWAEAILAGSTAVLPGDVDAQIAQLESGDKADAKNPNSSASGVGQFLDSTWLATVRKHKPELAGKSEAELLALKTDPTLGKEMLSAFRGDNADYLTARGVKPTATNLYAAHHFGAGGGVKFASASDSASMSTILSAKEIAANPYLKGKSVGEVKANWRQRGLSDGVAGDAMFSVRPQTEADAIRIANERVADPRLRRDVVAKIRNEWNLRDAQRQEEERQLSEQVYTSIARNTDPRASLVQVIGPDAYAMAERKGQLPSLQSYRQAILSGRLIQDDAVLVDALQREAVLSPATFKKRDLYTLSTRLSTDTLGDLLTMQADVNKPEKQAKWASDQDRVESAWRVLGLDKTTDPKGGNKARDEQRAAISLMYREAEKAFIQRQKKEPDQQQADALMKEVTRSAGQRLQAGTLTLGKTGALEGFGAALSPAERAEIIADYRNDVGQDPTEAQIVAIASRFRMQAP